MCGLADGEDRDRAREAIGIETPRGNKRGELERLGRRADEDEFVGVPVGGDQRTGWSNQRHGAAMSGLDAVATGDLDDQAGHAGA